MREEPCGSHQVDARASKWDISEALTEGEEWFGGGGGPVTVLVLLCNRLPLEVAEGIIGRVTVGRGRVRRAWRESDAVCRSNGFILPTLASFSSA